MDDRIKRYAIALIGVKELQDRENGSRGIFKEIMAKKFSVLKM